MSSSPRKCSSPKRMPSSPRISPKLSPRRITSIQIISPTSSIESDSSSATDGPLSSPEDGAEDFAAPCIPYPIPYSPYVPYTVPLQRIEEAEMEPGAPGMLFEELQDSVTNEEEGWVSLEPEREVEPGREV
eukprot:TRINITY_DN686_c0_g1_i15.p1 TRINITY_DN686_c0_g1~~TRINITY_DN686_c0_g1_i15.p1  ORF type:complete len:131 (+),score=7.49 TRINITY_DN686_c0_g1_i15:197-589(+)